MHAILTVSMPYSTAARLEESARTCGLKRATLARLVLERWLDNPEPLLTLPPSRQETPGEAQCP